MTAPAAAVLTTEELEHFPVGERPDVRRQ